MSAINELREQLAHTETAEFVTTMLRDISATRLQTIKLAYEANKRYYAELHHLMYLVQSYAILHNITLPETTSGTMYVALTSNRRFYGTLNDEVIKKMRTNIKADSGASCLIIGQTGEYIFEHSGAISGVSVEYASFQKDEPTPSEVLAVVQKLSPYTEVKVVHPTYINAFTQSPIVTDITHVKERKEMLQEDTFEYLIEPDIPKMLDFFRTQIRLVLFDRVLLETRFALTGARLMKMQRARERAEEMQKIERRQIHKEVKTIQSMRLLETFTGYNNENKI